MIKAVIFDMYETLITYYNAPLYFGPQMAADAEISEEVFLPKWRGSEGERTLGKWTIEEVLTDILRENRCYSEELLSLMMKKRMDSQVECFEHLHPEILNMLNCLKENGIRIGLITNCFWEEEEVIKNSILYPYFDVACFSCEMGIKKPDKEIFESCIESLGVSAEECIYIGDGGSCELEAARKIGMHEFQCVWYLQENSEQMWGRRDGFVQLERPMDVVEKVKELCQYSE